MLKTEGENKIHIAYFNLVCGAIADCMLPINRIRVQKKYGYTDEKSINYYRRVKETVNRRMKFINSRMVEMFCDCSDNFEKSKLVKEVKEFNYKQLLKALQSK